MHEQASWDLSFNADRWELPWHDMWIEVEDSTAVFEFYPMINIIFIIICIKYSSSPSLDAFSAFYTIRNFSAVKLEMFIFQAEANRSINKHRKIASSFRDTQLFEIFQLGSNLLKKAYEMIKTIDFSDANQVIV